MAIYRVRNNQNLLDVALYLYGSVEGVFDLLITNTWLDMDTDLQAGMELEYHDNFVINPTITERFGDDVPVPANGERNVYYKEPPAPQIGAVIVDSEEERVSFSASGTGSLYIDWGDNSPIEELELHPVIRSFAHNMDSEVEERRIRLYAFDTVQLTTLDLSSLKGTLLLTRPVTCYKFYMTDSSQRLDFMPLLEGLYHVDLTGSALNDLMPLCGASLQMLDLCGAHLTDNALENYLEYVASPEGYGLRRACIVHMDDSMVNETVRGHMDTILGEEEWNTPQRWKFIISGEEYRPANTEDNE